MSNPTTPFGWQMPTNTDLVTDLPADFEVFGQAVATSMADLLGGTTGQVLAKNTNADMDFVWTSPNPGDITEVTAGTGISGGGTSGAVTITNSMATAIDAKGDLVVGTAADTFARLASSGVNNDVLMVDTSTATGLKWSAPASGLTTFTRRLTTNTTAHFNTIAYNGSNLYVAGGQSGQLYTSTDGITWTSRTSGFGSNAIFKIAYGNGVWVAVGSNGTLSSSSDAITWTARTANMGTNSIRYAEYGNNIWVAVGGGGGSSNTGGVIYSTDGATWTRKSMTPTIGSTYYGVSWNGTNWIVVASDNTNNYLYATDPSATWTAAFSGTNNPITAIWWDGTRHYVAYANGSFGYGSSNTLGTVTQTYNVQIAPSSQITNSYGILYSGKLYTTNEYYLYDVTVDATVYPLLSAGFLSPSTTYNINTPYIYTSGLALWYGAAGWIIGGQGQLWTSF